jgi:hypothetical protein
MSIVHNTRTQEYLYNIRVVALPVVLLLRHCTMYWSTMYDICQYQRIIYAVGNRVEFGGYTVNIGEKFTDI